MKTYLVRVDSYVAVGAENEKEAREHAEAACGVDLEITQDSDFAVMELKSHIDVPERLRSWLQPGHYHLYGDPDMDLHDALGMHKPHPGQQSLIGLAYKGALLESNTMTEVARGLYRGHVDVPGEVCAAARLLQKTPDVSNYAQGRQRCWVPTEPPLGPTRPWQAGDNTKLGRELFGWAAAMINTMSAGRWEPELMLVTDASDAAIGITPHRDATYADYEAWAINLTGVGQFTYTEHYQGYRWDRDGVTDPKTVTIELQKGDVLRFNSKNLHAAESTANRLGLQLWRVSNKMRDSYKAYQAQGVSA